MLNIHIGSTVQGRSVDVGIQDHYAAIYIGGEGSPGGPAANDSRTVMLSIPEADRLSRLLLAAVRNAKQELASRDGNE